MNGVTEAGPTQAQTEEPDEFEVVVIATDDDLHELACRCRELLAEEAGEACEPGHWLG